MKNTNPKVTVLMPVYNGERYLREAVESILGQTFNDFEFLIINDGSTDKSEEIIRSFKDNRIKLISNENNLGLEESLNKGIDASKGDYIARMDCDDISLPTRLSVQVKFLDENTEVGICGTWIRTIGQGQDQILQYPTSHDDIKCRLLFESVVAHPTVMMRKNLLFKYNLKYKSSYKRAEDYELWVHASNYFDLANIGEILLLYRIHVNQIGQCFGIEQQNATQHIRIEQLKKMGIQPTKEETEIHRLLAIREYPLEKVFIENADLWLCKLRQINNEVKIYTEPAFLKRLSEDWFSVCNASTKLGFWVWDRYWKSELSNCARLKWVNKMKFLLKLVIKY